MSAKHKYLLLITMLSFTCFSQVGIGTTTPEAALDIKSTNNGVLVPRIALTSINDAASVLNPQGGALTTGTLIWNTATAGITPNNVVPGFYFWNGSEWSAIAAGGKSWSLTGNTGTSPGTEFIGTVDAVDLRIKTAGNDRFNFSSNGRLRSYDNGLTAQPTYSWMGDEDTGLWRPAANMLGFSTNAIERFRIADANQVYAMNLGTANAPFYSFNSDSDTGLYSTGADALALSTNGNERLRVLANGQIVINNTGAPNANDQFSSYNSANAVAGYSTAAGGRGLLGSSSSATGFGTSGRNTNVSGTGILGSGNNYGGYYLNAGSGGAFTGLTTGVYAYYMAPAMGQAICAQDAFLGQWLIGHYNGSLYKIIGQGTVSTIVKDLNNDDVVMHCTETPENLFEDYGTGQLVNGRAHIDLDPIFSKNIVVSESKPLKVFIQLEGECKGVYVTNKSAISFDVVELQGGTSNTPFSYSIVATRADENYTSAEGITRVAKYGDRFEKAPEYQTRQQETVSVGETVK